MPAYSKSMIAVALAAAALLAARPAPAAEDLHDSRRNAIVRAIERVFPAVVTINVVEIRRERVIDPFFNDFWGLFGPPPFGRERIRGRAVESVGTGFLIDREGHILTNYHVLQGASHIASVTLPDGRTLDVELVGADERSDIAVLRAAGANLPFVEFGDSSDLLVGEWVIAIGNPFGNLIRDPQPSVSVGVVSANHRKVGRGIAGGERFYQDLVQTDAAINPGNSGGPLVNALGQVVGINTMIFSTTGGHQGLGFAIPVNRARRIADEIIEHGRRRSPWLGFRGEAAAQLTPYAMQQLGVAVQEGVVVTEIRRDAPVRRAGLQLGDVITAVNGEPVNHPQDVDFVVWSYLVGDEIKLDINRKGRETAIRFRIEELPRR